MKTVGIIAEYNPFHNGHLYQIRAAKEKSGADYAVVVLSGDFTQRGIPAITDKYARAEMALLSGADLIIELPVLYACASAEIFAYGGVLLLDSLGIPSISFGCETDDHALLSSLADLLVQEPEAYKEKLLQFKKEGQSFPTARQNALSSCFSLSEAQRALLSRPNAILALEYLKAMKKRNSAMTFFPVKREGNDYKCDLLSSDTLPSADAIRARILSQNTIPASFMPASAGEILADYQKKNALLFPDDFSAPLYYKLLEEVEKNTLHTYADVSDALADKIRKNLFMYRGFTHFCREVLKSRDLTETRINRALLHILLGITKEQQKEAANLPLAPYVRVLGFKEASADLFRALNESGVPIICQLSEWTKNLSSFGNEMLHTEIFASHIYEANKSLKSGCTAQNEYSRKLIKV